VGIIIAPSADRPRACATIAAIGVEVWNSATAAHPLLPLVSFSCHYVSDVDYRPGSNLAHENDRE
jgi:hypothetical protein